MRHKRKKKLTRDKFHRYINMAVDKKAQERTREQLKDEPMLSLILESIDEDDPFSLRITLMELRKYDDAGIQDLAREVDEVFFEEVSKQWVCRDEFKNNLEEAKILCRRDFDERDCEKMTRSFPKFLEEFDKNIRVSRKK